MRQVLRPFFLALLLLLWPALASAQICAVRVNAMDVEIDESAWADDDLAVSRRESLLTWPSRAISRIAGTTPQCRSETVLTFMADLTSVWASSGYCLEEGDADVGYLLVPGERNFRGRCAKTTCDRVLGTADDLTELKDGIDGIFVGPPDPLETLRDDGAGALIVQASRSYFLGRLKSTVLAAAMSQPAVLAAAAVTVVAVGGGVYVCSE